MRRAGEALPDLVRLDSALAPNLGAAPVAEDVIGQAHLWRGARGGVYIGWLATVGICYRLCASYAGVKARGRGWWLSYL